MTWTPGTEIDGEHLTGVDLSGVRAPDCTVLDSALVAPRLDGAHLTGLRLLDSAVTDAVGASVRLDRAVLRDASWTGGRLGALDASGSTWTRVRCTGVKVDLLNLADARLADVEFVDCTLGELVLGAATGRGVRLVGCTVGVLELHRARVQLDVSAAELTGEVRGLEGLRGVTLSPAQAEALAPALVRHLGGIVAPG